MEPSNDMLSSLFSDPEKLQSAINMASSLFGGSPGGEQPPQAEPQPEPSPAQARPSPGNAAPAGGVGGFTPPRPQQGANTDYDPSAELMSRAMPVLNAIARSGANAVSREKVNLLNSLKPFVADGVGHQLDHAMRLVSMARMARSAMGQLGGTRGTGDDGTREI